METAIAITIAVLALFIAYWQICERQHVKANYYACNSFPALAVVPATADQKLTDEEYHAAVLLSDLEGNSIAHVWIEQAFEKKTPAAFRMLFRELKEQIDVAPLQMRRVLGPEAFEAINNLSHIVSNR